MALIRIMALQNHRKIRRQKVRIFTPWRLDTALASRGLISQQDTGVTWIFHSLRRPKGGPFVVLLLLFFSIRWGTSLPLLGGSSNSTVPGDQRMLNSKLLQAKQLSTACFGGFGFGRRAKWCGNMQNNAKQQCLLKKLGHCSMNFGKQDAPRVQRSQGSWWTLQWLKWCTFLGGKNRHLPTDCCTSRLGTPTVGTNSSSFSCTSSHQRLHTFLDLGRI